MCCGVAGFLWVVFYIFASTEKVSTQTPFSFVKKNAAEKCECKISLPEIFLHILRKKYNDEHPDAHLEINKQPSCLSEAFLKNMEEFAEDVQFVADNGASIAIEIDPQSQKPFIRMSLVKRYRDKKDFLIKAVDVNDVESGKYDSERLQKKFEDYQAK